MGKLTRYDSDFLEISSKHRKVLFDLVSNTSERIGETEGEQL